MSCWDCAQKLTNSYSKLCTGGVLNFVSTAHHSCLKCHTDCSGSPVG